MHRNTTTLAVILVFFGSIVAWGQVASTKQGQVGQTRQLPFPKEFEPARYLGKWYEVARLSSPSQPAGTLATAEYSLGENEEQVLVKNTAYDAKGHRVHAIEGKARLLKGDPPRLAVSFGPSIPKDANYYVMHVGKRYDVAVVGNLDRKSLWILSRQPVIAENRLDQLIEIAKDAGFETDKLLVSDWKAALADSDEPIVN